VSLSKKPSTNIEKTVDGKKTLNNFRSSSNYKTKKIQPTKQPSKPADVKNEAVPENEGSSFKNSKTSNMKNTPPETKVMKSPLAFLNKRHLSIQINLDPKSDFKQSGGIPDIEYTQQWKTETKDNYISRDTIDDLRRSPTHPQKSLKKNQSNFSKFEKKNLNYTQQVFVHDSSLDNIHETSDDNNESVRRHLDFRQKVTIKPRKVSVEENSHPNAVSLKTDRTVREKDKKGQLSKIPLGASKRVQIQNSAPQNKSNDDDLLDVLFNNSGAAKKAEETKERSISNDRSSNKAGSNKSFGSKIYVQKINDHGNGSLQSSINLTSVQLSSYISLNYSGSDSAGNQDT
jgi:hypothetical protein